VFANRKNNNAGQNNEKKDETAKSYFSLSSNEKADVWKEFNTKSPDLPPRLLERNKKEGPVSVISMSHAFFEDYDLYKHLNAPCRNMVQFGSSTGKFLRMFRKRGWNVAGYDFSSLAIEKMQQKGVTARQVDLDKMDETGALTYGEQLAHDVACPTNIVMVRILEYMSLSAQHSVLFFLMRYAASQSTFVIIGQPPVEAVEKAKKSKSASAEMAAMLHPNFWASHFGGRTDMQIIHAESAYVNDTILIVKKR